jgi:diguanylate cyclase (GGDEF)-like protein
VSLSSYVPALRRPVRAPSGGDANPTPDGQSRPRAPRAVAAHPRVSPSATADEEQQAARRAEGSSLLCEDGATRRRMLDMERHIYPARVALFAVLTCTLVALGPWVGWWPLAPLAVAAAGFQLADHRMPRSARPEYWIMGAWAFSQVMIGLAIVFTGGPDSLFLAWLAIPAATLAARFSTRGVVAGAAWTVLVLAVVTVGVHWPAVARAPQRLLVPLSLLAGVTLLSSALMRSDVQHRAAASVDTLTGLFNRQALAARATELLEQARVAAMPFALVIGDLDHFKPINDGHGHLVGDEVLREVAKTLRTTLRTFDYVFRYGGEEFVILLPGKHQEDAVATADRLRAAVSHARPAGIDVTISFGVGFTEDGRSELEDLINAADRALYCAKSDGRDCVRFSRAAEPLALGSPSRAVRTTGTPVADDSVDQATVAAGALEIARQTFLECRRVDLDEVARELGVSCAALTRCCGERDQLLGKAIGSLCVDLLRYVERRHREQSAALDLVAVHRDFMKLLVKSRPLPAFLQREPRTALRALTSSCGHVHPAIVRALEELLREQQAAGTLPPRAADLHNLADAVVRISEGFLYNDTILATEPQVERAAQVVALLLT